MSGAQMVQAGTLPSRQLLLKAQHPTADSCSAMSQTSRCQNFPAEESWKKKGSSSSAEALQSLQPPALPASYCIHYLLAACTQQGDSRCKLKTIPKGTAWEPLSKPVLGNWGKEVKRTHVDSTSPGQVSVQGLF